MPRKYASTYSIAGSDSTQLLPYPYGHVYGKDITGDGRIVISNGPRREGRREFHSQTNEFFLISYACLCHQKLKSINILDYNIISLLLIIALLTPWSLAETRTAFLSAPKNEVHYSAHGNFK